MRQVAPSLQLGVQVLCGANCEAISIALAAGASFIRADGFAFSYVSVVGLLEQAAAGKDAGAQPSIAIPADIKEKHSSG